MTAAKIPFHELQGTAVQLEFLPNPRSRKWRKGFISNYYSEIAYESASQIQRKEGYHAIRFVPVKRSLSP